MAEEKNVEDNVKDRMTKYESKFSFIPKGIGTVLIGAYIGTNLAVPLLIGGFEVTEETKYLLEGGCFSVLTGCGMDAVNYAKGYLNEKLEAAYKEK